MYIKVDELKIVF